MIPNNFMQTWKTKDIPDKWKISPITIKKYLPSYNYCLMTDSDNINFVKKYFPRFYERFKNFRYNIMRADAIRYLWLFKYGGIYMDLDFYLKGDISKLIDKNKKLVFVEYDSVAGKQYTNSLMMSSKNHPFWLMVIDEMMKEKPWRFLKSIEVYNTTGPYMLSKVIRKYIRKYGDQDIQILRSDTIYTVEKGDPTLAKKSYIGVLEGRSWHGPLEKTGVFFHQNIFLIIFLFLLLIIYILVKRNGYFICTF